MSKDFVLLSELKGVALGIWKVEGQGCWKASFHVQNTFLTEKWTNMSMVSLPQINKEGRGAVSRNQQAGYKVNKGVTTGSEFCLISFFLSNSWQDSSCVHQNKGPEIRQVLPEANTLVWMWLSESKS